MLCADLVAVAWMDASGKRRRGSGNLEDISTSGACIQMDWPVPPGTLMRISHPKCKFEATVKYCLFRDTGYFLGLEFKPDSKWSKHEFRPQHLLDPRKLTERAEKRTGRT